MNRQHIVKSISSLFPTERHNATKFGVNHVLMAITLASISGISRICRIAAISGDGLVRDMDEDGTDDTFKMTITLVFTK